MFEVKELLTVENILNRVDAYSIFKTYCNNFTEVGKFFRSEFRDDPNPSVVVRFWNNMLWYKDFGAPHKALNCFEYVSYKYNMSFFETLLKINRDFSLDLADSGRVLSTKTCNVVHKNDIPDYKSAAHDDISIQPIKRDWLLKDRNYWLFNYGIDKTTLNYYNVNPITGLYLKYLTSNEIVKSVFISKYTITYSYELMEYEGIIRYKIYSPYEEGYKKWVSNTNEYILQGWKQLPDRGDLLVITKSLKDVMVLYEHGIPSIAPQSENSFINEKLFNLLLLRFKVIKVLYDNDVPGHVGASKLKLKYNIEDIYVPNEDNVKDISDFRKKHGHGETDKLLIKLID